MFTDLYNFLDGKGIGCIWHTHIKIYLSISPPIYIYYITPQLPVPLQVPLRLVIYATIATCGPLFGERLSPSKGAPEITATAGANV